MKRIIYYHKGCPDGFGAAWSAWKKFGYSAKYIPLKHGDSISPVSNHQIYFLDICPPKEVIQTLEVENRVVVLDHHIGSKDNIEFCKEHVFDNERSGAGISWDYFFGFNKRPKLIDIIEDRDLWKWNVEGSEEALMVLDSMDKTFEIWDNFSKEIECFKDGESWGYKRVVSNGTLIKSYQKQLVKKACSKKYYGKLNGINTTFVNSSILQSFIGNEILKEDSSVDLAAIYYLKEDNIVFSLRSRRGGVSCCDISKSYGGGGHHCASGFAVDSFEDLK